MDEDSDGSISDKNGTCSHCAQAAKYLDMFVGTHCYICNKCALGDVDFTDEDVRRNLREYECGRSLIKSTNDAFAPFCTPGIFRWSCNSCLGLAEENANYAHGAPEWFQKFSSDIHSAILDVNLKLSTNIDLTSLIATDVRNVKCEVGDIQNIIGCSDVRPDDGNVVAQLNAMKAELLTLKTEITSLDKSCHAVSSPDRKRKTVSSVWDIVPAACFVPPAAVGSTNTFNLPM